MKIQMTEGHTLPACQSSACQAAGRIEGGKVTPSVIPE